MLFLNTDARSRAAPVTAPLTNHPALAHRSLPVNAPSPAVSRRMASRRAASIDVSAAASAEFRWFPPCPRLRGGCGCVEKIQQLFLHGAKLRARLERDVAPRKCRHVDPVQN